MTAHIRRSVSSSLGGLLGGVSFRGIGVGGSGGNRVGHIAARMSTISRTSSLCVHVNNISDDDIGSSSSTSRNNRNVINRLSISTMCSISNKSSISSNKSNIKSNSFALILNRGYHVTSRSDSGLIVAGVGLVVAAYGIHYAQQGYVAYMKSRELEAANASSNDSTSTDDKGGASDEAPKEQKKKATHDSNSIWYSSWFAKHFYDGGFEDKMTKREAALILGIREGADEKRVKEAYLRILRMNHPDRGGSAYLATKLNEAKEIFDKDKPQNH